MSEENSNQSSPNVEWEAETSRITALFPAGDVKPDDWWQDVVGEEPETAITQKGIAERREGAFHDRKLSLVLRPDRVDWFLSSNQPLEGQAPVVATTGKLLESLDVLQIVADRWMQEEHCPPFQRLALGAVLMWPVENRQVGYETLSGYLPSVDLDPVNSRDFSYQINRPKTLKVSDSEMVVNRLSKWSVAERQFRGLLISQGPSTMKTGEPTFACRLELDINTDIDFQGELDAKEMHGIFATLRALAVEISKSGDQP